MSRIEALTEMLSHDPANAFARYGLAIEYLNIGQLEQAIAEFQRLLTAHPDYTAGYFMAAQTLAKCNRQDDAVKMLREGIAVAEKKGDTHAHSEMQAMLDEVV